MIFTLSIRRCCRSFSLVCRLFPFLHPHPALLIRLNPFPSCPTTRIPPSSSYPHHPRQRRTVNILLRGRRNSVASPPTERFANSLPLPRFLPSRRRRPGEVRGGVISLIIAGPFIRPATYLLPRIVAGHSKLACDDIYFLYFLHNELFMICAGLGRA